MPLSSPYKDAAHARFEQRGVDIQKYVSKMEHSNTTLRNGRERSFIGLSLPGTGLFPYLSGNRIQRSVNKHLDYNQGVYDESTLAIYTIVALTGFSIYSFHFAVAGDNAPFAFFFIILVACLPVIAFASIY